MFRSKRCSALSNEDLIQNLWEKGTLKTELVREAMCAVDRKNYAITADPGVKREQERKNQEFCEDGDRSKEHMIDVIAYRDKPQPIGHKATISAPHMHAIMLE